TPSIPASRLRSTSPQLASDVRGRFHPLLRLRHNPLASPTRGSHRRGFPAHAPRPTPPRTHETPGRANSLRSAVAADGEGVLWVVGRGGSEWGYDEATGLAIELCDPLQVSHLLEAQTCAQPPARLIVVEMHREQRGDPEAWAGGDHTLHQFATEPSVLV